MKNKKIHSSNITNYIKNGDTLAVCGFTLMGACEDILQEVESSFLREGSPSDLTLFHAAGHSDRENGIEHLAYEGLVKRIIGSHWGLAPQWGDLISNNKIEAHCLPQGQLTHLFRDMASGKPGTYSKVGLGTFVDPRLEGGRVNEKAQQKESLVELLEFKNEEYLFYNQVPIDVCIIRGTTADEFGNITMEDEALKLEALSIAQATKRYGGLVIVQIKNYVKRGTLAAKEVVIPGIYVDYIIQTNDEEKNHRQTSGSFYTPIYTGEKKSPDKGMKPKPLSVRKVIGRRAVQELFPDAVVNLGTGIPGDMVGPVSSEEGILQYINLTVESGAIGGIPLGGTDFGISRSPEAIIEHPNQFDYYNGRGVDITFMGGAEFDSIGSVNVSKFGKVTTGCGGFIDITQNANKVIFCSTFTASGLQIDIKNGEIQIVREGKYKKFVDNLKQVTFSGDYAKNQNQEVIYVTERAVFELTEGGIMLTEIAPGVSLKEDILKQMEFKPLFHPQIKTMNQNLFLDSAMNFKEEFLNREKDLEEV